MASRIVSICRQAASLLISTVLLPSMTTPGPCGGIGSGVVQAGMSAPPAMLMMSAPMEASAAPLVASAVAFAAGPPGVPAAAVAAASAALIAASAACLGPCNAAAAAAST